MAEWTLRPVEPASLSTAALQRDPRDQPRDRRPPRAPVRSLASPALLQRLRAETAAEACDVEVELGPAGELLGLVVRERESGRVLRRFEGSAVEAILREPSAPGLLMERSG